MIMRAMDVRIKGLMGAMMIVIIKSRMRMRVTIPEENMREMLNTTLVVMIEGEKSLMVAPTIMRDNVITLTRGVKMVPMMMSEHVTLPTPMIKVR